jgi:signal transduction histidine kinase
VLTGLDDEDAAYDAVKSGAQDYLIKGKVDAPLLWRTMRYAIERKHAEEAGRKLVHEQALRAQAEAAGARWRFLADLTEVLTQSMNGEETIPRAARQLVPFVADSCDVIVVENNDSRVIASAEAPGLAGPLPAILDVPLRTLGRSFGHMVLRRDGIDRTWTDDDVQLAHDVGRRMAMALDNWRLYRFREEIIGIVSHDLRNPLNVIALAVQAMERKMMLPGVTVQSCDKIRRSAHQMSRLIDDLLDVVKLEAHALPLVRRTVDVAALISEAYESLRVLAENKGVVLRREVHGEVSPVLADRERLLQVLMNLGGNALRFTPSQGIVVLSVEPCADAVRFSVRDSGPTIAPEDVPRVFDRFYQSRREKRQGADLGLAIAKGIVLAHGGKIGVESRPGDGVTFSFTLPRYIEGSTTLSTPPTSSTSTSTAVA